MKKKLTQEQMKENARKIIPPMYAPPGELRISKEVQGICKSILSGREFQAAQDRGRWMKWNL